MHVWPRSLLSIVGITAAISVSACTDEVTPVAPATTAGHPVANVANASQVRYARPDEEHFQKLAQAIPGFGGYHMDDSGNLVVYLTDLGQSEHARGLLLPVLRAWQADLPPDGRFIRGGGQIVVRKGNFRFDKLAFWRDLVTEHLLTEIPGLVFTDAQESANLVVIGALRERLPEVRAVLPGRLAALGIPQEAVRLEESVFPKQEKELTDQFRPIIGGIHLDYSIYGSYLSSCTLGFVAVIDGVDVFVTAAHCSNSKFAKDDTEYHQNSFFVGGNSIGFEWRDPGYRSCGFLSSRVCRDSDANAVSITPGIWFNRGRIARTTFWGGPGRPASGSLTIDDAQPTWVVTGKITDTKEGDTVDKVGRTTGWTYGFVKHSCVDFSQGGDRVLRCQHLADYGSQGGDSGSPVFRITSFTNSTAQIQGTHWGGGASTSKCADCAVFSSIKGIDADLGTTTVTP
jgi:hypothetical protein